jgi:hypothetical protein
MQLKSGSGLLLPSEAKRQMQPVLRWMIRLLHLTIKQAPIGRFLSDFVLTAELEYQV